MSEAEPMIAVEENDSFDQAEESQLTRALMSELVRIRKKRKIGQEPIAKAIGVTQGRISQFENLKGGNMTLEAFLLYAQTIGASVVLLPPKKEKPDSKK